MCHAEAGKRRKKHLRHVHVLSRPRSVLKRDSRDARKSDAFGFAAGNDTLAAQRAERCGNDGVPGFADAVVGVQHDPIASLADAMCPRSI
jgi:hypothetical protein